MHDECNGSDVFGSDICTCRPYLTHAIEECIRGAQEGGVGLVVYCRKEGRALGEVTKFLVYNARKRQEGGDSASNYFLRTECVAGVQDMRFQELMPDVLHWLGVRRIHRLVSMSNMKFDAIVGAGIEVGERVKIPDDLIPADARVEMDAKKAAGYFTDGEVPDGATRSRDQGPRLVTSAVAESARRRLAVAGGGARALPQHRRGSDRGRLAPLSHRSRAARRARRASSRGSRARAIPDLAIPYHSRWRHFEAGGVDRARARCRTAIRTRTIDLTVVSVLLDAGAGPAWSYFEEATGKRFTRSEGLGVASFRAFADGAFSAQRGPVARRCASAWSTSTRTRSARCSR